MTGRARENLALAAGFGLSGYALRRKGEAGDRACFQAMLGAAPVGAVMLPFRDGNDSHLMPALVVAWWAAGLAAGTWLAARRTT